MSAFGSDPEAMRRHGERFESATAIRDRALCAMTEVEALAHAKDLLRTRIEPGADPRAGWNPLDARVFELWRLDDAGQVQRSPQRHRRFCIEIVTSAPAPVFDTLRWDEALPSRKLCRYVPCDVCRWRDPEHRAAMTERARKYATERVVYSRAV